jgi:hypothetical protein
LRDSLVFQPRAEAGGSYLQNAPRADDRARMNHPEVHRFPLIFISVTCLVPFFALHLSHLVPSVVQEEDVCND